MEGGIVSGEWNAPTRYVRSGDVRLAVFEQGDSTAPTVLLVHGYPDTHAVWDDVAAALADRFHVVAYDVRGAGVSDAPKQNADYKLPKLAQDLFAVADAVSPDRPVHVLAHDWGSIQAWEAVTEPDAERRIASYTSISGPCLDHMGHWLRRRLTRPTPHHLRQLLSQQLHSWYIVGFHLPVVAPQLWRRVIADRWGALLQRVEGVAPRPGHPAPTLRYDAVRGIALYRANMVPTLLNPRRRSTNVPVEVLIPTGDHYATPALTEDLERWVSTLWRRELAAKHWAPLTHGPTVARMVTELIDHLDGKPAPRSLARAKAGGNGREFAEQLVVVTGAGSGIGRATAIAFAEKGAEVVIADLDLASAERTAELAGLVGPQAHAYQVNVADEAAVGKFAADVAAAHGVPDVLVNNAGIGHSGTFLDTTTEEWQRVLDVNLWGVIYGCQAFGRLMVDRAEGGHIVNVSSAAAYLPAKILAAYATSKAAVYMLSDCLRAEVAGAGIGVSTICPGVVNTNITRTTTFSGLSERDQKARQAKASALYTRRNFGPNRVAAEIVDAVRHDKAVVPVTAEAKFARLLSRVSPAVLRAAAKVDMP
jgi:NAD(P)-dependent dehydrogenase (short-subunit alcohol dehydrogenase family)/pimeloyl-ACP methyl ester carboxylesterase